MIAPVPAAPANAKPTHVRWFIVSVLFLVTTINYADRATLSIVANDANFIKKFSLDPVTKGYLLGAFSLVYVALQIPGGWLLDRMGSNRVYRWSLLTWSFFTMAQGFVFGQEHQFTIPRLFWAPLMMSGAVLMLFGLRLLLGAAEAPSFPANSRIVAAWFPTAERGRAAAIFNSAQYFAIALFNPLMGSITHAWGWRCVFWVMGGLGLIMGLLWNKLIRNPREHPWANAAEVDLIQRGGGLVDLDQRGPAAKLPVRPGLLLDLLKNRMLLGIFLGQYCVNGLTWFFLTWFPIYLVQERGMTILKASFMTTLPALCGFVGGVLGGWVSDQLLRNGRSHSAARKIPIVAGLLLSSIIIACNYVDTQWAVIFFMSLAFFGKGIGSLGWSVMADVAPKEATGLAGGLFNTCGNLAGIITPIVIGYILKSTGSFNGALVFVGAHGLMAVVGFVFIAGEFKRFELTPAATLPR